MHFGRHVQMTKLTQKTVDESASSNAMGVPSVAWVPHQGLSAYEY
jgi:hypothetical protein